MGPVYLGQRLGLVNLGHRQGPGHLGQSQGHCMWDKDRLVEAIVERDGNQKTHNSTYVLEIFRTNRDQIWEDWRSASLSVFFLNGQKYHIL